MAVAIPWLANFYCKAWYLGGPRYQSRWPLPRLGILDARAADAVAISVAEFRKFRNDKRCDVAIAADARAAGVHGNARIS